MIIIQVNVENLLELYEMLSYIFMRMDSCVGLCKFDTVVTKESMNFIFLDWLHI